MKAVLMAGGEGSRLRPLTIGRPKPMVPIVGKPVAEHILGLLKRHGITEVVVTVQYLANVIQDYFGDGSQWGMKIRYSVEETPLGTAGSVKKAEEWLTEDFIVISGDALTDFNLTDIIRFHIEKKSLATLTLAHVPNPLDYGVIITTEEGRIIQFLEKPSWSEVFSDTINTGIYILSPKIFSYFEPEKVFDFSQDLFPLLLKNGDPMFGYIASGYWCDVGNLSEYMRANAEVLQGKVNITIPGKDRGGRIYCEAGVEIASDAQIYGPVFLGHDCKIKSGAIVHGPSVIGSYAIIEDRAQIDRSLIWSNSYIGDRAELRGAIVGSSCSIKGKAVIFEGAVVGDSSIVHEGAIIQPNVKIWPNKEVEMGAVITSSIIWGSQGRRVLFGRFGVTGLVNVDITPEFAAKLGAAYGAILAKGSTVCVNRDAHRTPRMIKRAIIAGLPSAGVCVHDLESVPVPVARYYIRTTDAVGGIHIRLSPFDRRIIDIRFFDSRGLDLDKNAERKIENLFFREDFRRVYLDDIGTIEYATEVVKRYTDDFLTSINRTATHKAKLKLVVDYAHGSNTVVLPGILNKLGCEVIALNASMDESKFTRTPEEFEQDMNVLSSITATLKADLGVRIDTGGEKVWMVDHRGRILEGSQLLAVMASLILQTQEGGTIVVPVTAPSALDRVIKQYNGKLVYTKVNPHAILSGAMKEGVALGGDGNGGFVFPSFQPAMDGMMAIAKILEMLAIRNVRLADVIDELPPYHLIRTQVPCPWEQKGKVMRMLSEQYRERHNKPIDGIKITLGEEWVLILPDADRPIFHVLAESSSTEQATALAEKYAQVVSRLQQ